jgi:hypothetical protein
MGDGCSIVSLRSLGSARRPDSTPRPVMPLLHDPAVRSRIESRLKALKPDAPRQWGSMTSDQMLWHVNQFLGWSIGEGIPERQRIPMPLPIMRFFLLYMPWPKGAPTHKQAVAKQSHDFEAERARCLALIDRFVARPVDGPWPDDPIFGFTKGTQFSKLQAKHLDHHFRQFGA